MIYRNYYIANVTSEKVVLITGNRMFLGYICETTSSSNIS